MTPKAIRLFNTRVNVEHIVAWEPDGRNLKLLLRDHNAENAWGLVVTFPDYSDRDQALSKLDGFFGC